MKEGFLELNRGWWKACAARGTYSFIGSSEPRQNAKVVQDIFQKEIVGMESISLWEKGREVQRLKEK